MRGLLPAALLLWIVAPRPVEAIPIVTIGSATVAVGDLVTIPLSITGADDLTSWQFDLAFDPAVVQANAVAEGPFLSSFGTTLFGPGVIDNSTGLISIVTDAYVDLPPTPSGDGVLAGIDFLALAPGVSPLVLSSVFLNLSFEEFDIQQGQITVIGVPPSTAIPEPATLVLLTSALCSLPARHFRRRRSTHTDTEAGS